MSTFPYLSFNLIVQDSADFIKDTLESIKGVGDEIVIIDGGSRDNTVSICRNYTDKIFHRPFNNDFAAQKNYANSKCTGRWIFNLDSDEILSTELRENLIDLCHHNEGIDLIWVPRVNKVEGITDLHLQKWGWKMDADGDINWPDYQGRLYKNAPGVIRWVGFVHERIIGYKTYAHLPDVKDYGLYLIHHKTIQRQEMQNAFYSNYQRGLQ